MIKIFRKAHCLLARILMIRKGARILKIAGEFAFANFGASDAEAFEEGTGTEHVEVLGVEMAGLQILNTRVPRPGPLALETEDAAFIEVAETGKSGAPIVLAAVAPDTECGEWQRDEGGPDGDCAAGDCEEREDDEQNESGSAEDGG